MTAKADFLPGDGQSQPRRRERTCDSVSARRGQICVLNKRDGTIRLLTAGRTGSR